MKIKMYGRGAVVSPSFERASAGCSGGEKPWELDADVYILCAGRHPVPEGLEGKVEYIYHYIQDPMDFGALELAAERALQGAETGGRVYVYVTGLTSALVAVMNVLRKKGARLTLMHFDRVSGCYRPQYVC